MVREAIKTLWVFNGDRSQLPAGVFTTKEAAEAWIREHRLSGTLTEFPADMGAYQHAVREGSFTPKKPHEFTADFIADFTPRLYHEHWLNGSDEIE